MTTHDYLYIDDTAGGGTSRANRVHTDPATAPGNGTAAAVVAGLLQSHGCGVRGAQEGKAELGIH